MSYTDISICSNALMKLGAEGMVSFDDGTSEAEVASNLYPLVKDSLVSSYPWSFATLHKRLPKLAKKPIADYANCFLLPNDCLRIISAGVGSRGKGVEYKILENMLYTNAEEIIITYIFKPKEETFPAFFIDALTTKLAAEFAIALTEDINKSSFFAKRAEEEIRNARLIDSQQKTPEAFQDFTLVEARK